MITTTDGLPITYEAFPGNTHEVKTLLPVIKKSQREFEVESVDFAADRGMFSAGNLVATTLTVDMKRARKLAIRTAPRAFWHTA